MVKPTKPFFLLFAFALTFHFSSIAQNANEVYMQNWMALQQLLHIQATAPWSLTASDKQRMAILQGLTPSQVCANQTNTCRGVNSPLPVTGLKLKGERLNAEKVALRWETLAEYNSKEFVIERQAFNSTNQFDSVGVVTAAGTSYTKSFYERFDLNNYRGASFYRIRQVDNDGKTTYSNTIKIDGSAEGFAVNVVPNPAKSNHLRFYFTTSSATEVIDFTVSNAAGMQFIKKEKFNAVSGYYEMNNKQLPPGYYFITVYTQSNVYTKAFVVME